MNITRKNRLLAITVISAFLFMTISPALSNAAPVVTLEKLNNGPYLDTIVFKVISTEDNMIYALQSGAIDLHDSFIEPDTIPIFAADPNIDLSESILRNGYGHIVMKCDKAPMNWTAFRRAFAMAYDKTKVQTVLFKGLSELQDSLIVQTNELFSIESELPYHYYNPEVVAANQLLNDSGFGFDPVTHMRTDPNGNPIDIDIAYSPSSVTIAGGTAQIGVDALTALHIKAQTTQEDFNAYYANMNNHGDFDMIFFATGFTGNDLTYFKTEYGSEYADQAYQNAGCYRNETVDRILDDINNAATLEEAQAAAAEFQLVMMYECPRLICYENYYLQGYRNDKFTGFLYDRGRYLNGKWNLQQIRKLDGNYGGTLSVRIGQDPDTFNFFTSSSGYAINIRSCLFSSLYDIGPDLNPYPVLAESYIQETHADNSAVPEGHERYTINIIQNATWSDGVALTAEDVAFTFNYMLETAPLGNPSSAYLMEAGLLSAYAPSTYQVILEFGIVSYWSFVNAMYNYVIPKHIFEPGGPVGYEGWDTWNPGFNPSDPFVTCGPYKFSSMQAGDFYEIVVDPYWAYIPADRFVTPSTTTPPTTTTPTGGFNATLAIVAGAVGAAVVILVGGFVLLRQK